MPAQLSVPGIATIASVATTMARVAADTDLGHVLPFVLLRQSATITHKLQVTRTSMSSETSETSFNGFECLTFNRADVAKKPCTIKLSSYLTCQL